MYFWNSEARFIWFCNDAFALHLQTFRGSASFTTLSGSQNHTQNSGSRDGGQSFGVINKHWDLTVARFMNGSLPLHWRECQEATSPRVYKWKKARSVHRRLLPHDFTSLCTTKRPLDSTHVCTCRKLTAIKPSSVNCLSVCPRETDSFGSSVSRGNERMSFPNAMSVFSLFSLSLLVIKTLHRDKLILLSCPEANYFFFSNTK